MARAPETAFYFEPIAERLALVVEGSPFPSDDHWAWLGDPIEMTPQQAALLVAVRWPGIDPADLNVEFDLNFDRAVQEAEAHRLEKAKGETRVPTEFDVDIDQLLAQAEAIRDQVRKAVVDAGPTSTAEQNKAALEAAAQAESLRALIEQARALTQPPSAGQAMSVGEAKPQSQHLLHAVKEAAPELGVQPALEGGTQPALEASTQPRSGAGELPASRGAPTGPVLTPEVMAQAESAEPAAPRVAPRRASATEESDAELEPTPIRRRAKPAASPAEGEAPPDDGERKGTRKRPPRIARGALRALEEQEPPKPAPAKPEPKPDAPKVRPRIDRPKIAEPLRDFESGPPEPPEPKPAPRRPNIRKR